MLGLPKSNTGAAIGGAITTVVVFILQAIKNEIELGRALPETLEGWERLLVPALVAGALAVLTPALRSHDPNDPSP